VDAARGDVRGDEHRAAGVHERLERPAAGRLRQPAVDRLGLDADGLQVLRQPVDAELGAGEDDRPARPRGQLLGHRHLVAEGDGVGEVLGRRRVVAGALDLVPRRVLEVAADQGVDLAVQGGREQQPLGVGTGLVEQLLHDGEEAEVGHEVGLVDDADLDLGEGGLALADQVLQPAGGGDDDVDAAAQLGDLAVHRGAAVDGGELQAHGLAERGQGVGDLLGQLARGHEDQRAGGARAAAGGEAQAGQHRQAEGQRLAGAGGGLAQHVAPGERVGQDGGLDGEGSPDVAPLEGGDERLGQAQLGEGGAGRLGSRREGVLGVDQGVDDVDGVDQGHAGVGLRYSSGASRGGGRAPPLRQGSASSRRPPARTGRSACTDALMPGRTVREDVRRVPALLR
jgi:hypothetical protein